MVWRKGRRPEAGGGLMIDRALTWRNSMPRNSPRPMWRSASGNSASWASSPSVLHRTGDERSERTFATRPPRVWARRSRHDRDLRAQPPGSSGSAGQVVVLQPARGHVGRVLLVDLVALVELGQLLGGEGGADLVDRGGELVAVGLGQLVLHHGHDVVGGQHLLV